MDIVISRGFLHHEKGEEKEEKENRRPGKLDIIIHSYGTLHTLLLTKEYENLSPPFPSPFPSHPHSLSPRRSIRNFLHPA